MVEWSLIVYDALTFLILALSMARAETGNLD